MQNTQRTWRNDRAQSRPRSRNDASSGNSKANPNRWYDATVGKWLSQDPSGLGPDTNTYRYCGNGPMNAVDPSGLKVWVYLGDVTSNGKSSGVQHITIAVEKPDGTFRVYDGGGENRINPNTGRPMPDSKDVKSMEGTRYSVECDFATADEEIAALDKVYAKLHQLPYRRLGPNSNTYAHQLLKLAGFKVHRHTVMKMGSAVGVWIDEVEDTADTIGWNDPSYGGQNYDEYGNEK